MKILIVDDQEGVREALEMYLNCMGHEAILTENAADGLTALENEPEIVGVLLDINLPGGSGLESIGAFKKISPNVSVVMISGAVTDKAVREAVLLGAEGIVGKPFVDLVDLCAKLKIQNLMPKPAK